MANVASSRSQTPPQPKASPRVSFRSSVDAVLRDSRISDQRRNNTTTSQDRRDTSNHAVDTGDPWTSRIILSLDGGGIRGFSTLLILKQLMEYIGHEEKRLSPSAQSSAFPYMLSTAKVHSFIPQTPSPRYSIRSNASRQSNLLKSTSPTILSSLGTSEASPYLPCHYFDYIAGTSTGGLIAIMLSRLRMSVDECITEYIEMGHTIYRSQGFSIPSTIKYRSVRKNTQRLEEMLKEMVKRRLPKDSGSDQGRFASRSECSRTIVVTVRKSASSSVPYLLRSYEHPIQNIVDPLTKNPGPPLDCMIWEAARATTAAPSYFKPMKIDTQYRFIDSGLSANNPSWLVLNEVEQMHGSKDAIEYVISVGTGVTPISLSHKFSRTFIKAPKLVPGMNVRRNSPSLVDMQQNEKLERWDVSDSDDDDFRRRERKLWRSRGTLEYIEQATKNFLESPDILKSLQAAACKLVRWRRKRADTPQWESYVLGVAYACDAEHCPTGVGRIFQDRNELVTHFQRYHNLNSPGPDNIEEIEKILARCKITVDRHTGKPLEETHRKP